MNMDIYFLYFIYKKRYERLRVNVAGVTPITSSEGIENIDLSFMINSVSIAISIINRSLFIYILFALNL